MSVGVRFWSYLALSGVAAGIFAFAFATTFAESARGIDTEFYAASATMLPVLLLALLVRIGRASEGVMRMRRKLRRTGSVEEEIRDLEAVVRESRAAAIEQGDERSIRQAEDQLRRLKDLAEDANFKDESLETAATTATEVMFAALLVALAFASAGGGAALVALASGQSTWLTLALTCLGLVWLLYSLIALEIASFQSALVADFLGVE